MLGLLGGDTKPIVEERTRQAAIAEPSDEVPGEIDRVELDMGERVQERDPPRRRAEIASSRHVARRAQDRMLGPRRAHRRGRPADRHVAGVPACRQRPAQRDLARRIGGIQDRRRALGEGLDHKIQSAFTACSTSATWPGTLTLCHTLRTMPSLSIRKVARSIPMYLRPYMLFSTQTP